jgi:energy-converting hydrogenase B subunit D
LATPWRMLTITTRRFPSERSGYFGGDTGLLIASVLIVLSILGALAALLQKDLIRASVIVGAESVALALIFHILLAPDLALTQAVVGTALLPGIIIIAVYKTRRTEED